MKYAFFFPCLLLINFFLFNCNFSFAQSVETAHLIEEIEFGQIDWSAQFIEARGKVYINDKIEPRERAVELAVRGAKAVARANIVEAFSDILVTRTTRVEDLIETTDEVTAYLSGTLKRSKMVGKPAVNETSVEVTMRIPLYNNGLTDELIKKTTTAKDIEIEQVPLPEPYKKGGKMNSSAPLHGLVLPIGDSAAIALNFPDGQFKQSLFPIVVDEDGDVVVDMAKYYSKFKNQYGNYVDVATGILKASGAKKALEVINAVQDSNGVIHINTNKQPKVKNWLKTIKKVGSVALPILLTLL